MILVVKISSSVNVATNGDTTIVRAGVKGVTRTPANIVTKAVAVAQIVANGTVRIVVPTVVVAMK